MLDIAQVHPVVEDIWNFFPFNYCFSWFAIAFGNFIFFIPNIFLRPIWYIWNFIFLIPNIYINVLTAPFNA
tara:strand:- start:119 stop:331 length:213 start_codon:yes stop_codon:yes gene_type:complete